jgi:ubiquinone/menaquinone biosynthesis C-methylase UbiE
MKVCSVAAAVIDVDVDVEEVSPKAGTVSSIRQPFDEKYRRWYTAGAGHYDDRFEGDFARIEGEFLAELIRPTPEMTILDVGTGTGRGAIALAQHGAHVTGVDLTPRMLERAAAKRDALGLEYPTLICANARKLPFPDESFDVVISIRMLHLFPTTQLGAFVDEMKRVLKPGGTLLIEFNSPFCGAGWIAVRETIRHLTGQKDRHYLWPQHLDSLFGDLRDRQVFGFWFPGISLLTRTSPRFAPLLKLTKIRPPFGWVGDKVLVRAVKPR